MNINTLPNVQLPLFVYGEPTEDIAEVLPAVWNATECLTSPEKVTRQHGIDSILELGAQKISPLVAFMIATRLEDTDIYIRRRIIYILADLILWEPGVKETADTIRLTVSNYLHNMGEETVYDLLEVAVMDSAVEEPICHILNTCPYAGRYLGNILTEWKNPLPIRQKAIYFVGMVGYMEALPVLERLLDRLKARQKGQFSMSFAPSITSSEEDIMPYLHVAINRMSVH
jgi:hypothetical protein